MLISFLCQSGRQLGRERVLSLYRYFAYTVLTRRDRVGAIQDGQWTAFCFFPSGMPPASDGRRSWTIGRILDCDVLGVGGLFYAQMLGSRPWTGCSSNQACPRRY